MVGTVQANTPQTRAGYIQPSNKDVPFDGKYYTMPVKPIKGTREGKGNIKPFDGKYYTMPVNENSTKATTSYDDLYEQSLKKQAEEQIRLQKRLEAKQIEAKRKVEQRSRIKRAPRQVSTGKVILSARERKPITGVTQKDIDKSNLKLQQLAEEQQAELDTKAESEYTSAIEAKPVYDETQDYNKYIGDINTWAETYSKPLGRGEERFEQTQQLFEDINKEREDRIKQKQREEIFSVTNTGFSKEDLLKGDTATYVQKEVNDIRQEKKYEVWGSSKGSNTYHKLQNYKTKKEAEDSLKYWTHGSGGKVKEITFDVNYGKKTITEIKGEGNYVKEYDKDGNLTKITERPKEYTSNTGYSKQNQKKKKKTYIPYEAHFDKNGNMTKEIKRDIRKKGYDYSNDWGNKTTYVPYEKSVTKYKDGKLIDAVTKEEYKKSSNTSSSGAWSKVTYGENIKFDYDFDKGAVSKKQEFDTTRKSWTATGHSGGSSSYFSYLKKDTDYVQGLVSTYGRPKSKDDSSGYKPFKVEKTDEEKADESAGTQNVVEWDNLYTGKGYSQEKGFYTGEPTKEIPNLTMQEMGQAVFSGEFTKSGDKVYKRIKDVVPSYGAVLTEEGLKTGTPAQLERDTIMRNLLTTDDKQAGIKKLKEFDYGLKAERAKAKSEARIMASTGYSPDQISGMVSETLSKGFDPSIMASAAYGAKGFYDLGTYFETSKKVVTPIQKSETFEEWKKNKDKPVSVINTVAAATAPFLQKEVPKKELVSEELKQIDTKYSLAYGIVSKNIETKLKTKYDKRLDILNKQYGGAVPSSALDEVNKDYKREFDELYKEDRIKIDEEYEKEYTETYKDIEKDKLANIKDIEKDFMELAKEVKGMDSTKATKEYTKKQAELKAAKYDYLNFADPNKSNTLIKDREKFLEEFKGVTIGDIYDSSKGKYTNLWKSDESIWRKTSGSFGILLGEKTAIAGERIGGAVGGIATLITPDKSTPTEELNKLKEYYGSFEKIGDSKEKPKMIDNLFINYGKLAEKAGIKGAAKEAKDFTRSIGTMGALNSFKLDDPRLATANFLRGGEEYLKYKPRQFGQAAAKGMLFTGIIGIAGGVVATASASRFVGVRVGAKVAPKLGKLLGAGAGGLYAGSIVLQAQSIEAGELRQKFYGEKFLGEMTAFTVGAGIGGLTLKGLGKAGLYDKYARAKGITTRGHISPVVKKTPKGIYFGIKRDVPKVRSAEIMKGLTTKQYSEGFVEQAWLKKQLTYGKKLSKTPLKEIKSLTNLPAQDIRARMFKTTKLPGLELSGKTTLQDIGRYKLSLKKGQEFKGKYFFEGKRVDVLGYTAKRTPRPVKGRVGKVYSQEQTLKLLVRGTKTKVTIKQGDIFGTIATKSGTRAAKISPYTIKEKPLLPEPSAMFETTMQQPKRFVKIVHKRTGKVKTIPFEKAPEYIKDYNPVSFKEPYVETKFLTKGGVAYKNVGGIDTVKGMKTGVVSDITTKYTVKTIAKTQYAKDIQAQLSFYQKVAPDVMAGVPRKGGRSMLSLFAQEQPLTRNIPWGDKIHVIANVRGKPIFVEKAPFIYKTKFKQKPGAILGERIYTGKQVTAKGDPWSQFIRKFTKSPQTSFKQKYDVNIKMKTSIVQRDPVFLSKAEFKQTRFLNKMGEKVSLFGDKSVIPKSSLTSIQQPKFYRGMDANQYNMFLKAGEIKPYSASAKYSKRIWITPHKKIASRYNPFVVEIDASGMIVNKHPSGSKLFYVEKPIHSSKVKDLTKIQKESGLFSKLFRGKKAQRSSTLLSLENLGNKIRQVTVKPPKVKVTGERYVQQITLPNIKHATTTTTTIPKIGLISPFTIGGIATIIKADTGVKTKVTPILMLNQESFIKSKLSKETKGLKALRVNELIRYEQVVTPTEEVRLKQTPLRKSAVKTDLMRETQLEQLLKTSLVSITKTPVSNIPPIFITPPKPPTFKPPTPVPITPGGWIPGLYGQGGSAGKRRKSKRYAIRTFGVLDLLGAPKESNQKESNKGFSIL